MKRIELAAAETLQNARFYLARLPIADQNTSVHPVTNEIVNDAIPLLFLIECQIKLENSQF